jgi:hypothetical protein
VGGGHFGRFFPYSPLTSLVCLPLECYGCNWDCRFHTEHCVKDIAPQVIAKAITETLAGPGGKPRVFVQQSAAPPGLRRHPRWAELNGLFNPGEATQIQVHSKRFWKLETRLKNLWPA